MEEGPASTEILRCLVNYPIGAPAHSWDDVTTGAADEKWVEKMRKLYASASDVPFIPCVLADTGWFVNMAYPAYGQAFRDSGDGESYERALRAWSSKIALLRDRKTGGAFPWSLEAGNCNWLDLYEGTREEWDVHIHLEALFVEDRDSGKLNFGTDDYGDDWLHGHRSFELSRNMWLAAEREGYPEFGNALLSFYLMRKAICDARDHAYLDVDWLAFSAHLQRALVKPGHRWVRQALEFMKSVCREKDWRVSLLRLRNIAPDSAQVLSFPAAQQLQREPRRDECERRIVEEVGEELWLRWSEGSRRGFLDAEQRFDMHAPHFGRGVSQFGAEIIAYAMPFERELNLRLRKVYLSMPMKEFWIANLGGREPNSNPTFGSYLTMLTVTRQMPASLIAAIEASGVNLHRDESVLGRLKELQVMRNKGAHGPRGATPGQLVDVRQRLFGERLLRDFLRRLDPV